MCLICRLSRETKQYPIKKRADKDRSITNTVMAWHKIIWTLSLREGGIFIIIFFFLFKICILHIHNYTECNQQ